MPYRQWTSHPTRTLSRYESVLSREPGGSQPVPESPAAAHPNEEEKHDPAEGLDVRLEVEEGRWQYLPQGALVEFASANDWRVNGTVDPVMPDGSAVWIWLAGGHGRIMFCPSDGLTIRMPEGP